MKRLLTPFLMLMLAMTACHQDNIQAQSDATTAAQKVYKQYANRKELTVALIGDYQGYNAVMLSAQTPEGWLQLCEEFGVTKNVDATALDSVKTTSLTKLIFPMSFKPFDVNDERTQTFLREWIKERILLQFHENLKGNPQINLSIDSCVTINTHVQYNYGVLVDSTTEVRNDKPNDNQLRLTETAIQHGHTGYIIYDDSEKLTLWLFFYSTQDEQTQIINNVILKN